MGFWKRVNVFRRLDDLEDDLNRESKKERADAIESIERAVKLMEKVDELKKTVAVLATELEEMRAKAIEPGDKLGAGSLVGVLDEAFFFKDELAEAGIEEVGV